MKRLVILITGLALAASCSTGGVDRKNEKTQKKVALGAEKDLPEAERLLEPQKTVEERKEYPSGLKIQWFTRGEGPAVKDGEVYEINYKVKLVNGDVVDGNHLLRRDWIPYLVGFGMQPKGWDLAMQEMKVGDFAEVYLPANLARGKEGIPGLIPPNSPNIIMIRIGKRIAPTRSIDGVRVWVFEESEKHAEHIVGEDSRVALHYFVGSKSNPRYDNSYRRNAPFRFTMSDYGLVPGLRKALINAKLFDKMWIVVPASEAYGSKGYQDLVKPNESMFYDLFVTEVDGVR